MRSVSQSPPFKISAWKNDKFGDITDVCSPNGIQCGLDTSDKTGCSTHLVALFFLGRGILMEAVGYLSERSNPETGLWNSCNCRWLLHYLPDGVMEDVHMDRPRRGPHSTIYSRIYFRLQMGRGSLVSLDTLLSDRNHWIAIFALFDDQICQILICNID